MIRIVEVEPVKSRLSSHGLACFGRADLGVVGLSRHCVARLEVLWCGLRPAVLSCLVGGAQGTFESW